MFFFFAILLGIYSYSIFFLGILGWLYRDIIILLTILFWGIVGVWWIRKNRGIRILRKRYEMLKRVQHDKVFLVFGVLFSFQVGVNLIGVLGPELGFDALWYHLTLPKLYLLNHSIDFIPGGLLYYSAMPKLGEMLYTAGLAFGNESLVKFIHYLFGIFTCLATYKLSRKFFSVRLSLIAVVIFYSNLVVGWESTSAYIDLVRAFFEVMALWAFINWFEDRKKKWFVLSALMVGLAITTKLLAMGSLLIFMTLIVFGLRLKKKAFSSQIRHLISYNFIALAIPMPWFIFSYLHTGNPVYPFFTKIYKVVPEPLSLFGFVKDVWMLFTQSSDPISYVYIFTLPGVIWVWKTGGLERLHGKRGMSIIGMYSLFAIIIWYFTPRTGGGRFILPYLPALSILCVAVIDKLERKKKYVLFRSLLVVVFLTSLFSIGYRFVANSKYIPVIIGKESKAQFLAQHLHFDYGDFYDIDGYFAKTIKPSDNVLLLGFHNLYYVDFPFVDATWVKEKDRYNYIAVQKGTLPDTYKGWKLVYQNDKTMVKLYKKN